MNGSRCRLGEADSRLPNKPILDDESRGKCNWSIRVAAVMRAVATIAVSTVLRCQWARLIADRNATRPSFTGRRRRLSLRLPWGHFPWRQTGSYEWTGLRKMSPGWYQHVILSLQHNQSSTFLMTTFRSKVFVMIDFLAFRRHEDLRNVVSRRVEFWPC